MSRVLDDLGRKALFLLDPETAHGLSIAALRTGLVRRPATNRDPRLSVNVAGISLSNPIGIAAGYDKNADVVPELAGLGFGFVEIGTVTPKPQSGNPKPRIFRLPEDKAVINRLGFNNYGHAHALRQIVSRGKAGVLGINIGANKDSSDRIGDYVEGIGAFAGVADYFTVNISSPNTPGLRDLQNAGSLTELLCRVLGERDAKAAGVPVFLKIAPDLQESDLDMIAGECLARKLDGVIISNTTLSRTGLSDRRHAAEAGGLSGRPLFERSTIILAKMRQRLGPTMALIGVGGVSSARDAAEKIRAGADLVQFYTGFVYGGPALPGQIIDGLSAICDHEKLDRLSDLRDGRIADYAALPIPD